MKNIFFISAILLASFSAKAQISLDGLLPVRGFCIASPQHEKVDEFNKFIKKELAPRNVNTLVLRVHYNYAYESHPELRDENPLTKEDI